MIRKQISLWSLWIYFRKLYQKRVMKTSLKCWPDLWKASGKKRSVKYEIEWVIMTSLVNLSPLPSSCPLKLIPRLTTGPIAQSTNYLDLLPPTPSIYPWLADRDNYNPLKWNWPSDRNWQGRPFFGQLVSDIWWGPWEVWETLATSWFFFPVLFLACNLWVGCVNLGLAD